MLRSIFEPTRGIKLIAYFLFFESCTFFILSLSRGDQELSRYHGIRFLFMLCAIIVGRIRKNPRYYIPAINELPDQNYWFIVNSIMFSFTIFLIYFRVDLDPLSRLTYSSLTLGSIYGMLVVYQTKPWTRELQSRRERRIKALRRKSHLTKEEFEIISELLAKQAAERQKTPKSLRIIQLFSALILGSLLNIYSRQLVDLLSKIDFLNGLLRP